MTQSLKQQHGGHWGEHPDHPVDDWQHEVLGDETRLGYWEWVENRIDAATDDDDDDE